MNIIDPVPSEDDVITTALVFNEYVTYHMMHPGIVENGIMIMDNMSQGVLASPIMKVKAILQTVQSNYKCRARTIFSVNQSTAVALLWHTVKFFIDEATAAKVMLTSSNTLPELVELCHPSQLEEQYGGSQPSRQDGQYWPPHLVSEEFGAPSEENGPAESDEEF